LSPATVSCSVSASFLRPNPNNLFLRSFDSFPVGSFCESVCSLRRGFAEDWGVGPSWALLSLKLAAAICRKELMTREEYREKLSVLNGLQTLPNERV